MNALLEIFVSVCVAKIACIHIYIFALIQPEMLP